MTKYDHYIDKEIVLELKNGSRTASELFIALRIYRKISWTTLYIHIKELCNHGIIEKLSSIEKSRKNNEMPYTLTFATKSKIARDTLDIEKLVETEREDPTREEEIQRTKHKKIRALLFLQAVDGSSQLKPTQESKLGNVEVRFRDAQTGRIGRTSAEIIKKEGVTAMDIVQKRDVSNGGLFSHIKFDESDVKKYYYQLISEFESAGLSNIIIRKNVRDGEEAFSIQDYTLRSIIGGCSVLIGPVKDRIEETLELAIALSPKLYSYKYNFPYNSNSIGGISSISLFVKSIKRQRKFIQQAFDWYMSSFGDKRFNEIIANARVRAIRHIQLDDDKSSTTFWKLYSKAAEELNRYVLSHYEMHNRLYDMIAQTILAAEESTGLKNRERKLKEKEKKQKYIQEIQKQIDKHDRHILSIYHCQIKSDKYADEELERGFEKYYASIRRRDLPPKYYDLRDRIVDLLYPEFLRKEHKRNPKLKEYVDSLPQ
ncbi:MAG: hypothetical protein ACJ71M_15705 [Nitrososphaeraceae archaeon]